MGTGKTPLRGRLFCWQIVRVRDNPERDSMYAEELSESQQYPKVVLFGKSLSGSASELGLDLSLFCKFFFVDGIDFIGVTLRWFPISDMLRALLLDSLLTLPVMFLPGMLATGVLVLSFVPFFAATLSNVVHILLYHAPISTFAIQSIFETTSNEAREFATDFFSIPNALILMVVFVIPLFLLVKAVRARKRFSRPSLQWCVLALILCTPIAYSAVRKGPRLLASHGVYQFCTTLCRYTDEIRAVDTVRSERQNLSLAPVAFLDGDPAMPRTYVFIVGESANRNHLSLYGYKRNTTPKLEAMRDELVVFEDVISPDTHTIPSLRKVLLFSELQKGDTILTSPSVLTLLNSAGFTTYWISNQAVNVEGATGVRLFAEDAKQVSFLNMARDEGRSVSYDSVLLPELEKILGSSVERKAIFIHLMGSHLTYALRYPPEFGVFSSTDDIPTKPWRTESEKQYVNTYDNSIRYTDHIVSSVINAVKRKGGDAFVVYFSDHGQEVYDTRPVRGQIANDPSKHMLDIPFLCWFSPEYQRRNAEFMQRVKGAIHKPWMTSGFADAAAELARLSFGGGKPEKAPFSASYEPWVRYAPNGSRYDSLDK